MSYSVELGDDAWLIRNSDWSGEVVIRARKVAHPMTEAPFQEDAEWAEWRIPAALIVAIRHDARMEAREAALDLCEKFGIQVAK